MYSPGDGPSDTFHSGLQEPALLSRAGVGVVRLTPAGEIVAANDAFVDLADRPRDALAGEPFVELLTTYPPSLEAMFDGGGADGVSLTLPVETGEGGVVACESFLEPVPADAEGAAAEIVAVLSPDSERSPAAEPESGEPGEPATLPESEAAPAKAFVALADALPDGIIVLDTESRIQYANPAVERILGHAPDDLVGGSKLSIIPERLREVHLSALRRYLETGQRNIDWEYVELPGQHKDGHEVPLGISLNDFAFDGDRYFVGLFRDISPRKEAERALRERERRLNQYVEYTDDVLDAIDDVFYVVDANGELRRWNRTVRSVTGYDDEEIESMRALDFFEEDDRAKVANAIAEVFETGHARIEANVLTKEGDTVPYELVASSLEDPDGVPVLAGIARDVTDQKEQQRRLEESNERLEQFAYAASHDLREPLRMVTSYLQLLEQRYGDEFDEEGEEFIDYAVDGAERMREMIDGLLAYSRVETQGDPLEPVDLDAVLDDIRDDLRLRIDESDATIRADDLPTVAGDGSQLRQVFQNLLSNAIEYSGDEPPWIEITTERPGDRWRISVSDQGIGIDADDPGRVFEVFQRLHSREEHAGTGLGLALCRRIVERHDGRIWVDSEPGEGSTFHFTLPPASESE